MNSHFEKYLKIKKKGSSSSAFFKILLILIVAGFVTIVSFNGVAANDIPINDTSSGGIAGAVGIANNIGRYSFTFLKGSV